MKLTRPLVFLDIESATANENSPDPQRDRIIEIAALKFVQADLAVDQWYDNPIHHANRYNPGIPIHKKCSDIHKFTDDMVKAYPPFSADAKDWHEFIGNSDLAGFGIWFYDLPLLVAELDRCGLSLCWRSRHVIDASLVFKKKEERTLTAAAKFYCQKEHEGAHGAMADTIMSVEVLKAQLQRYPDVAAMPLPELHKFCQFDERLTLDGKIAKGPDGDPIYTFGKVKGSKVKDDLGFADWMLYKASFPRDTTEWLQGYIQSLQGQSGKHQQDDMFV